MISIIIATEADLGCDMDVLEWNMCGENFYWKYVKLCL